MKRSKQNKKVLSILLICVCCMIGVAYASVPLYRMFCNATGYNGTTQRVSFDQKNAEASRVVPKPAVQDRYVTITFDSNVDAALPWEFKPETRSVRVKLGEIAHVTYYAENHGDQPVVGMASFNVQPDKIGSYFDKIQCFCFTKQMLKAGQKVELPVQFYVDPALAGDHQADDVQNITLSYTFFRAKDQRMAHKASSVSVSSTSAPSTSTLVKTP